VRDFAIHEVTLPAAAAPPVAEGARAPAQPRAPLVVLARAAGAPTRAGRALRGAALVLAVAAHAGLIYALAREPEDWKAGGQGRVLDAISVTIVSSAVLESLDRSSALPVAPASAGAVEADDGASDAPAAEKKRERKSEDAKAAQHDEERKAKRPIPEPVRAEAVIEAAPAKSEPPPAPESPREAAGGMVALGDAPASAMPSGPAAASPGAVQEYGNNVRQALGKTRPKEGVAREPGRTTIEFVISAGGTLVSARVLESSGNERLDEMALAAVQSAVFPGPPPGMTIAQLTYWMTYTFR